MAEINETNETEKPVPQMDPTEMQRLLKEGKIQLVDLRDDHEREICTIPGATHIPFPSLEQNLGMLATDKPIVLHCKGGGRATRAARLLESKGIKAINLTGGIMGWIDACDPSQKKY